MSADPTYIMSAKIQDLSGDIYISFIRDLGDPIMNGLSAKDFLSYKESNDPEEVKEFIKGCYY